MAKPKQIPFNTTKGTAMYPWLNKPDFQFDSSGQYKVNLRIPKADAADLVAQVTKVANENFGEKGKQPRLPFKTDDETGDTIVMTRSKFQPKFVDSQGSPISENNVPAIYGGSTLKLGGMMYAYNTGGNVGISLQLSGVQIVDLADRPSSGTSFTPEEGGFVAAEQTASNDNEQSYNF
jgi:hypothetical protein